MTVIEAKDATFRAGRRALVEAYPSRFSRGR